MTKKNLKTFTLSELMLKLDAAFDAGNSDKPILEKLERLNQIKNTAEVWNDVQLGKRN